MVKYGSSSFTKGKKGHLGPIKSNSKMAEEPPKQPQEDDLREDPTRFQYWLDRMDELYSDRPFHKGPTKDQMDKMMKEAKALRQKQEAERKRREDRYYRLIYLPPSRDEDKGLDR